MQARLYWLSRGRWQWLGISGREVLVGREKTEGVALEVALGSLGRMGSWKEPEWGCPVGEGRLSGPGLAK